jgi:hypothetical protein
MAIENWLYIFICLGLTAGIAFVSKSPAITKLGPWINLNAPRRLPEEIVGIRCLFAFVLYLALPPVGWVFQSGQPHPNGLGHWIDFSFLAAPGVWPVIHYISLALIVLYALGLALPVVLPLILLEHLCVFTLNNSQGYIGHSMQLVTMIILAQAVGVTLWPLWKRLRKIDSPLSGYEVGLSFTSQTMAAAYVICGLTKLINSEGKWISDVPNLAMQLHKTAMMDYYNTLEKAVPPLQAYMEHMLIEAPGMARVIFGSGLVLELAAILALLGRRWELALGVATILMHKIISQSMSLSFPFHIWVLFIFWVNAPYWIGWAIRRLRKTAPAEEPAISPAPSAGILHGE